MPENPFNGFRISPNSIALANAMEVTPSDTDDLPIIPRAISSKTGGRLRVAFLNGEVVEVRLKQAELYHFQVTRIFATGTGEDSYAQGITIFW